MSFKHNLCIWQFLLLILLKNTWSSKSALSAVVAEPTMQQISSLSCLSGCWLKQHNFFSQLFWTDLPFCCPDGIFAFKHRCSCGLGIIGAFLFFPLACVLQFLCVRSWDGRLELACLGVGWPTAPQASPLMSFPRKQVLPVHQASAVRSFELKLLCVPAQAFVPCKTML